MKVKIKIHSLGSKSQGVSHVTVRFAGNVTGKIYSWPFRGRVTIQSYEANIQFLEDVCFHSATSDGPFDFELESAPDSAEVHFYA